MENTQESTGVAKLRDLVFAELSKSDDAIKKEKAEREIEEAAFNAEQELHEAKKTLHRANDNFRAVNKSPGASLKDILRAKDELEAATKLYSDLSQLKSQRY
jgi:hypothetical protein